MKGGRHPLRLALITRRYPPLIGGAERMLSYLAVALAETGAQVTVLTSHLDHGTPAQETIATSQGSCRIERLPTSSLRFLGTLRYMRALRGRLRGDPPDLAYVSMLKHDAAVAIDAGRRLGFPVVLRPEGAGDTGDIAWQKWGRFGQRIAARCRTARMVVAISSAVRQELLADGYDPARVVEIGNGVPVPALPWQPRPEGRGQPRLVYVGRLAPEKGLDTLMDAWPEVLRAWPTAELWVIGSGPLQEDLTARVAQLARPSSVRLLGAQVEPAPLLRQVDLFVLPSREEGMSMALLEAMALGMPLVVSSIPGNRKLVADFRHGRLFPVQDPAGLAHTIDDQLRDYDRAIHMGRFARQRVEQKHSIEAVARKHLELFDQVLRATSD